MTDAVSLAGKVALVTGGSRGIGRRIVEDLAAAGAQVGFTYLASAEKAEALAEEIRARGGTAQAWQCDSRDPDSVQATVKDIGQELGSVELLVNNAGVTRDKLLVMMKEEDWREVVDTDLTGVYHFCRAVVFGMSKEKRGRIVNVGSVSGLIGNKGQVNYSAAKAGVIGLTKALAKEVARSGITVNVVAPGYIETEMIGAMPEKTLDELKSRIPMRRFGTAEEVSKLVCYLLEDHAGYITGQTFTISGGLAI